MLDQYTLGELLLLALVAVAVLVGLYKYYMLEADYDVAVITAGVLAAEDATDETAGAKKIKRHRK